jgi:hypothetical protein
MAVRVTALLVAACLWASTGSAGQGVELETAAAPTDAGVLPEGFSGPSPPVLPESISRDGAGRVTLRAVALTTPLRLDGQLDDAIYREVKPASDFIQTDPDEGASATERTDVWIFFDRDNVYIGARMWESQPERMVVSDMRRDSPTMYLSNEILCLLFFYLF